MVKKGMDLTLMWTSCTKLKLPTKVLHRVYLKRFKVRMISNTIKRSSMVKVHLHKQSSKQRRKHSLVQVTRSLVMSLLWTSDHSTSNVIRPNSITSHIKIVMGQVRKGQSFSLKLISSMQQITKGSTWSNLWIRVVSALRRLLPTSMGRNTSLLIKALKEDQCFSQMQRHSRNKLHQRQEDQKYTSKKMNARLKWTLMQESRCSMNDACENMMTTCRETQSSERTCEDSGHWRATPQLVSRALLHRNLTRLFRNK